MGEVRRIAVTGAGGFLGLAVVAEARARGLDVVAIVRSGVPDWARAPGIDVVRCDLADPGTSLNRALPGTQAVIHTAAHVGGDPQAHTRDTVNATAALLDAMSAAGIAHLVLASSIAVYDVTGAERAADGVGIVTERTPVAAPDRAADAYAAAKIAQEHLVASWTESAGRRAWLMRAGAIYGPGRLWNAHLGVGFGPLLVRLGTRGELPIVHIRRAAKALVDAALTGTSGAHAVNLLDDDLPDRTRFLSAMRCSGWPKVTIPIPWQAVLPLAKAAAPCRGRPGLFREAALRARMTPSRYPNDALRAAFADRDRGTFEDRFTADLQKGAA